MSRILPKGVFDWSTPFAVLAFDPGGTTGWASCTFMKGFGGGYSSPDQVTLEDLEIETGELTGQHHKELFDMITDFVGLGEIPTYVVRENFEFRQFARAEGDPAGRSKLVLDSVEYIGVISLCAQLLGVPVKGYPAGEAKSYVPDAKLDKLGWLVTPKHPNRHRNDALRQLVKFLIVDLKVRHPITTAWTDDAD